MVHMYVGVDVDGGVVSSLVLTKIPETSFLPPSLLPSLLSYPPLATSGHARENIRVQDKTDPPCT